MKRLGISIYPEIIGNKKTIEYVKKASELGFKRIFANLIELKNNSDEKNKLNERSKIYKLAKQLGFEVILDVNPEIYKEFNLPKNEINFFRKLGATGIRLDEDFKGKVEAQISNNDSNFKIEINASTGTQTAEKIIKLGGNNKNILALHNFYPMEFTGLSRDRFIELSSKLKQMGVKTAAFITLPKSKNNIGPWNINDGMPSIEEHRHISIRKQISDLISLDIIDDIIISQQGSISNLEKVANIFKDLNKIKDKEIVFNLNTNNLSKLENEILFKNFNKKHSDRLDFNNSFIRSTMPRIYYKNKIIEPKNSGKLLKRGDVVIINKNLGRYAGEVHILKKDLDDSKDMSRNLVARVIPKDLEKIDFVRGHKFVFRSVHEKI